MKGSYVLILRLAGDVDLTVGKLGKFHFGKGYYYYIGSALGTGGFKRVTRHFNIARGKNSTRKWHIDHLLPHSEVLCAVLLPSQQALECKTAQNLENSLDSMPGFGCSDCKCLSHLLFSEKDIRNEIMDLASRLTGNESIIIYPDM
jgi:endonuclease-3